MVSGFRRGVFLGLAGLTVLTAGCGGASLTTNARAIVVLTSRSLDDLELVVTAPDAVIGTDGNCREGRLDFGCRQNFFIDATEYRFESQSRASRSPYGVYVRNRGTESRVGNLEVQISDRVARYAFSLAPGEARRMIEIRRFSAEVVDPG